MTRTLVERVRRFNRTVTERIGALDDDFLGRGRSLGEARLLWEIGDGADVRELRARLGLDSGYLSRLLGALKAEGLIRVEASRADGRLRRARLTRAGRVERRHLDRLSDELAAALLHGLPPSKRDRLVDAMDEVERLLAASMVEIVVEPPDSADAVACLRRYFAELDERFDGGFVPERSHSPAVAELTQPAGALLLARLRGEPVACGSVKLPAGQPAEIKRLWIAPSMRGVGLGRRMLAELEGRAARVGARVVRLETNRALTEAIKMYRDRGYREVEPFNDEPYAHHWFEKVL